MRPQGQLEGEPETGDPPSTSENRPPPPAAVSPPREPTPPVPTPAPGGAFDAPAYLKRMLEYEVTHDPSYEAVSKQCAHRITVELYPLKDGWTVFARFSRFAREEKVDYVTADELAQLAQRLVRALLHDKPIGETITRENVLKADSERWLRTVGVRGHARFGMGTALRLGQLPTAEEGDSQAQDETRLLTPITLTLGYRGKLKAWGLDAVGRLHLGTRERAAAFNEEGGHVDYLGGAGLALHFFRYVDAPGVTSLYFGGGASFDLALFSVIRDKEERGNSTRDQLLGGGLNLDVVVGYELMRASSLHFFTQLELNIPAYFIHAENKSGTVNTYLPGGLAQVGVIF